MALIQMRVDGEPNQICYVSPIQFKNANNVFGVGKKRTSYVLVSRGCIIVELDFPEFNLCKE